MKEGSMAISIQVENIKCGGCASGIRKKLLGLETVKTVEVDVESGTVVCATENSNKQIEEQITQQLLSMGYPKMGSVEGLQAAGAKAKSFVSCAVGKMNQED